MSNPHIYIFNGKPRTGKSDLARLIASSGSTLIIDDTTIPNTKKEILKIIKNIPTESYRPCYIHDVSNVKCWHNITLKGIEAIPIENIIIIVPYTDDKTISKLIDVLYDSERFSGFVISYVKFTTGVEML